MMYNLQVQVELPALSQDDGVDKKYKWKYVSKEIMWMYSLNDKPSTDAHQVEKLVESDQQRSHDGESGIHVASQTFERIDTDQNQQAGFKALPTSTKAPLSSDSQSDGHDHHQMRMAFSRRDPSLLGIDTYGIYLRSIGLQLSHHHEYPSPSVSGGDDEQPNVKADLEKDDHVEHVYSSSQLPSENEQKCELEKDVPDKIINGHTQSQLDTHMATFEAPLSGAPPTEAPPSEFCPAPDTYQQSTETGHPPSEFGSATSTETQPDSPDDEAPPSDTPPVPPSEAPPAGVKARTENDTPPSEAPHTGVKDRTLPTSSVSTEDDAPPSPVSANTEDRTAPAEDDAPPSPVSANTEYRTPPTEDDAPPSPVSDNTEDRTPPTEDDAPPSEPPSVSVEDKNPSIEDEAPVSIDDKICSTEDEAPPEVHPSDFDNVTTPSKAETEVNPSKPPPHKIVAPQRPLSGTEASLFGIKASPTGLEIPPPFLCDGEQEEQKHEPEYDVPDVIIDRTYYWLDNVSSVHVPYHGMYFFRGIT